MKAVLLALLAIGLALQPGAALQCYSCTAQMSNQDCHNVKNCSQTETYCWTSHVRAIGILKLISKGCTSECVDDADNYYVGKKNITCCSTNLCNVSGAYAVQPATTLGLLTALIGLLLWGSGQL
ncbi:prostate stem cell antigen [Fukomys damarensis]|uniref:Prostate stem cell antigen n=1 Tax=Fukomys damarensis TaxID=885580 RepID=A0A091D983_FUKDA|nr:prostate stem cell antigen [Fukomys damarensis]KFO26805.1 Prostate stem cell antigen [Fukomys damarensis]